MDPRVRGDDISLDFSHSLTPSEIQPLVLVDPEMPLYGIPYGGQVRGDVNSKLGHYLKAKGSILFMNCGINENESITCDNNGAV